MGFCKVKVNEKILTYQTLNQKCISIFKSLTVHEKIIYNRKNILQLLENNEHDQYDDF